MVREELAPIIQPDGEEASAVRFDALMYGIELAYLMGRRYKKGYGDLLKKVNGISHVANIPEIRERSGLIDKILHTDYLERAGIFPQRRCVMTRILRTIFCLWTGGRLSFRMMI